MHVIESVSDLSYAWEIMGDYASLDGVMTRSGHRVHPQLDILDVGDHPPRPGPRGTRNSRGLTGYVPQAREASASDLHVSTSEALAGWPVAPAEVSRHDLSRCALGRAWSSVSSVILPSAVRVGA